MSACASPRSWKTTCWPGISPVFHLSAAHRLATWSALAGPPPENLQDHSCLVFRYPVDGRLLPWGFMRDGLRFEARFGRVLISDDIDALTQMALNDGGITRLAEFVVRPHLDAGRLVPLFENNGGGHAYARTEPMDVYLCLADRFALTTKVRVFMEYLQQCLGEQWPVQA